MFYIIEAEEHARAAGRLLRAVRSETPSSAAASATVAIAECWLLEWLAVADERPAYAAMAAVVFGAASRLRADRLAE